MLAYLEISYFKMICTRWGDQCNRIIKKFQAMCSLRGNPSAVDKKCMLTKYGDMFEQFDMMARITFS